MQYVLALATMAVLYVVVPAIVIGLVGARQETRQNVLPSEPRPAPPAEGQSADRQA